MHVKNFKLTLEYDGTDFLGFQVQARGRTVQGELERALAAICREPVRSHPAGRTDTGVHASGQVVSFGCATRLDAATLGRALNARLPRDLAVVEAVAAPAGFHARHSAIRRRYRYTLREGPVRAPLRDRYAWAVPPGLDVAAMNAAAATLLGEHDFAAFSGADPALRTTVRRLERLAATRCRDVIAIDAHANAFLPHMVRYLVGLLVAVGAGRLEVAEAGRLLAGRDRRLAPRPAPPHGLCLVGVDYPPEALAGSGAGMERAGAAEDTTTANR